ncbi:MAG: tetratricopeptide repeat protein, partial [Myxococcota bacterium]
VLLAQELNVQLKADEPVAQLGQALRRLGRVLVVFDNVEPMVELADVTVGVWLREATEALFVVTSRQSLGLGSECLLELTPFTPPIPQSLTLRTIEASTEASWSLDLLRANDAVVLFVESARLVKPDFELTDANAVDIAKLVGQLDGLPLAIELAAARIRSMSPATILARLGQRFRLLRSNRRDISPRQMTLKAALDGSWELMEPIERIFLIQCAVFEGSFNLEAAETILDLSIHEDSPWVIDLVDALVHKSLLRTVQGRSELRYSMYASVRDYAHTRLQAEPELQASLGGGGLDLLRGRHLNYFSRYGSPMSIRRLDQGRSPVEELGRELDNIAAALRWALTDGRWAEATRCAQALSAYFLRQGPARAGLEVIDHLVESSPDNLPPHGALLGLKLVRGRLALAVGRLEEAEDAAQQVLANVPPGSVWRIQAMHLQAILLEHGGHLDNAISLYTSAVALAQQLGDTTFEAKMLAELVASLRLRGRFDEAVATGEHAVRLLRRLRLVRHEGSARILLANTLSQLGRLDEAEPHYIRALEVLRATGDRRLEGWCLMNLGLLSRSRDQAIACFQASLTLADRFGDPRLQSYVLQNLAYTLADLPEHLPESLSYARRAAVLAQEVGERRAEAWTLLTLASALTYAERFEEAQTRIDEAALLGESIPEPALHREIHIVRALLARALGDVPGVQAMLGPLRHILDHNEHDDDPPARVEVNALQAWVWIQQGLHDDASALLKASRHLDPNLDRMPYLRPLRLLTEVAAMLA